MLRNEELLGIHSAEVFIGVFIGAVTFTGSIVAFLKLSARIKSNPLMLPGKNLLNLGALVAFAVLTVWFVIDPQLWLLVVVTVIALALGWHLVASIGGGDMPVVVSMLNSYSGLGGGGVGLPAGERPADHHRRPGRLLGCLPVLHHVQGDEPLVHLGDRRRLRHRGRATGERQGLRRAPRDHRRGRRRAARRRRLRDHHPRLRHGRGPGPVRRRRADPEAARQGRGRPVRHPPGRRPAARAT